jgi:hypothetical protein
MIELGGNSLPSARDAKMLVKNDFLDGDIGVEVLVGER